MRMFVGVAATLTLASGVALAAAGLAQDTQQPGVWVSKDGTRTAIVGGDRRELAIDEDDVLDDQVRHLAVLAGRGAQLGVSVRDLDAEQAKGQSGAVVEDVRAGSAAEKAGIKKGDVIAEFDGERVRGVRHLTRLVTETPDGRTVKAARPARGQARGPVGHAGQRDSWPAPTATSSCWCRRCASRRSCRTTGGT